MELRKEVKEQERRNKKDRRGNAETVNCILANG
jgi:hypothetical protein